MFLDRCTALSNQVINILPCSVASIKMPNGFIIGARMVGASVNKTCSTRFISIGTVTKVRYTGQYVSNIVAKIAPSL